LGIIILLFIVSRIIERVELNVNHAVQRHGKFYHLLDSPEYNRKRVLYLIVTGTYYEKLDYIHRILFVLNGVF